MIETIINLVAIGAISSASLIAIIYCLEYLYNEWNNNAK